MGRNSCLGVYLPLAIMSLLVQHLRAPEGDGAHFFNYFMVFSEANGISVHNFCNSTSPISQSPQPYDSYRPVSIVRMVPMITSAITPILLSSYSLLLLSNFCFDTILFLSWNCEMKGEYGRQEVLQVSLVRCIFKKTQNLLHQGCFCTFAPSTLCNMHQCVQHTYLCHNLPICPFCKNC